GSVHGFCFGRRRVGDRGGRRLERRRTGWESVSGLALPQQLRRGLSRRAGLVGYCIGTIDASRRASPESPGALAPSVRPRDLPLQSSASGFALGAKPLALRFLGFSIGFSLRFLAQALFFLEPSGLLAQSVTLGQLSGPFGGLF